jgi:hypothetical protein
MREIMEEVFYRKTGKGLQVGVSARGMETP